MVSNSNTPTAPGPFTAASFPGTSGADMRVLDAAFARLSRMRPDMPAHRVANVVSWSFVAFCAAERNALDDLDRIDAGRTTWTGAPG